MVRSATTRQPMVVHNCLSLQYLTGWKRLQLTAALWGNPITEMTAKTAHAVYRTVNPNVVTFWEQAAHMMTYWAGGSLFDPEHYGCVVAPDGSYRLAGCRAVTLMEDGLRMPNGFRVRYPHLKYIAHGEFRGWSYWNASRNSRNRVHPGLVLENLAQALTSQVMDWQLDQIMVELDRRALTAQYAGQVHDENVFVAAPEDAHAVGMIVQRWMATAPPWWPEIVLDCEGGDGAGWLEHELDYGITPKQRYGFAK